MLRKFISTARLFLKSTSWSKVLSNNNTLVKMAENLEAMASKRPSQDDENTDAKKLKTDDAADVSSGAVEAAQETSKDNESSEQAKVVLRKKKVALFMMYSGVGYYGMQIQLGDKAYRTIEGELLKVLTSIGAIPEEHARFVAKMAFQRAARTDKGVSAAANCVSLKLLHNMPNLKEKINAALPDEIKIIDILRTTATFDSKNYCDARTYSYMLPTFAFTPVEEVVYQTYRAPDGTIKRVNDILSMYKGTHNFHNFTSGKKPNEMSANRFIIDMACSEPFVEDDVEFAVITVKGQSFMLHQIRKMIGLMIAIVRGLASLDCVQKSFGPYKTDVPKAPGLGLMLEKLHYDTYNRRYGKDGLHVPLAFANYEGDIKEFKKKYIYSTIVKTEKEEKSMLGWMRTLHYHKFDYELRITGLDSHTDMMNWLGTLFSHNFDYRLNIDVPPRAEVGTGRAEYIVEKLNEEDEKEKVNKGDDEMKVETVEKSLESETTSNGNETGKCDLKMEESVSELSEKDSKISDSNICGDDSKAGSVTVNEEPSDLVDTEAQQQLNVSSEKS